MFDANLIKITQINIVVSLRPNFSFLRSSALAGTEDSGLSHAAMQEVYQNIDLYSHIEFCGYRLPYTMEALFFDDGSGYFVDPEQLNCIYRGEHDLHLQPDAHPLSDSLLKDYLKLAYAKRRWDNLGRWGEPSAGVFSRALLRIAEIDRSKRTLGFSKTDYDTQAVTNLVPDMVVRGHTLRKRTFDNGCLPGLSDRRIANNLGISILFLDSSEFPFLPLRADEGVAVFPGEWGCTVSFAADFPDKAGDPHGLSFQDMIHTALSRQVHNELKAALDHLELIPLALTREWFRLGKTQLFMACRSPYTRHEIGRRLKEAPHQDEVADRWGWLLSKNKVLWDGGPSDRNFSIEALCNWALYLNWKRSVNVSTPPVAT